MAVRLLTEVDIWECGYAIRGRASSGTGLCVHMRHRPDLAPLLLVLSQLKEVIRSSESTKYLLTLLTLLILLALLYLLYLL